MDDEGTTQYVPLERMGPVELASSAFGQTTSTTPIQMITAACAVINGGYLVQPHVVKQVLDADGNIVENVEPEVKRQVLSAETKRHHARLLTRSVNMTAADGKTLTGGNKTGYVAGYKAGGKSGTSQRKQALSDEEQTYYSSYWGFAPGDDPQIAVLVMLDTPHDEQGTYYGGRLAAPVVQSVLDEALQTLGVPKGVHRGGAGKGGDGGAQRGRLQCERRRRQAARIRLQCGHRARHRRYRSVSVPGGGHHRAAPVHDHPVFGGPLRGAAATLSRCRT